MSAVLAYATYSPHVHGHVLQQQCKAKNRGQSKTIMFSTVTNSDDI